MTGNSVTAQAHETAGSAPAPEDLVLAQPEFRGRVGIARTLINPPENIYSRLWGSSTHDVATGLHKPLYATCAAVADSAGGPALYLLTADLSWWRGDEDWLTIRAAVLARAGIRDEQLFVHVSHTHSAPSTSPDYARRPGGEPTAAYRDQIIEAFARIITDAQAALQPAIVTFAVGRCQLAFNRNLELSSRPGVVVGINPLAQADDTLLVGRVCAEDGGVLATFVNYACHPISLGGGNTLISPDYVGLMREIIESATDSAPCLFLHGASGDQTPRRSFASDADAADRNGAEVGYAALSVLASMSRPGHALAFDGIEESGAALAIWREKPVAVSEAFGVRTLTESFELNDIIPTRQELLSAIESATEGYVLERLTRRLSVREAIGDGPTTEFTFWVVRLGDGFIVATPSEAHSTFQLELRRRFPGRPVAVLNIVNGYRGYLPPREEYERLTYQAQFSCFQAGTDERVLDLAEAAMRDLLV